MQYYSISYNIIEENIKCRKQLQLLLHWINKIIRSKFMTNYTEVQCEDCIFSKDDKCPICTFKINDMIAFNESAKNQLLGCSKGLHPGQIARSSGINTFSFAV